MTYSKVVDSLTNITIYKYDYYRFQFCVGSSFGFLTEDQVRELIEYLENKLDGK